MEEIELEQLRLDLQHELVNLIDIDLEQLNLPERQMQIQEEELNKELRLNQVDLTQK